MQSGGKVRIFTGFKEHFNKNLLDGGIAEVVYYTIKYEGVIPRGGFCVTLFRQYGLLARIAERMRLMHSGKLCMGLFLFCRFLP